MASNNFCPTCPTDCAFTLPSVSADICAPEYNSGQIGRIYLTTADATGVLTDVTDLTEWNTRLSQAPTNNNDIITLSGVGSKPKATSNTVDTSLNRSFVASRDHSLQFNVDDTNQLNYDAMRALQCGGTFRLWYEDVNRKYIYGGNSGILVELDPGHVIPESDDELNIIDILASWKSKCEEERDLSPFA